MATTQEQLLALQKKYTNHVFVHVHRSPRCTDIPHLDKFKFIVPRDMTVGSFLFVVRRRMQLPPEKALFLFVNNTLPTSSSLISAIYAEHATKGILQMYYAGENTFGFPTLLG